MTGMRVEILPQLSCVLLSTCLNLNVKSNAMATDPAWGANKYHVKNLCTQYCTDGKFVMLDIPAPLIGWCNLVVRSAEAARIHWPMHALTPLAMPASLSSIFIFGPRASGLIFCPLPPRPVRPTLPPRPRTHPYPSQTCPTAPLGVAGGGRRRLT